MKYWATFVLFIALMTVTNQWRVMPSVDVVISHVLSDFLVLYVPVALVHMFRKRKA